jgi:hypothetical protein
MQPAPPVSPNDLSPSPVPEQTYCNPEMEIFRQRRLSQTQPKRRLSLAEVITDWPSLEYTEKPEYRMKEASIKPYFVRRM